MATKRGAYTRKGERRFSREARRELQFTKTKVFGRQIDREAKRFFSARGMKLPPISDSVIVNAIDDAGPVKRWVRYRPDPDAPPPPPNLIRDFAFRVEAHRQLERAIEAGLARMPQEGGHHHSAPT